MNIEGGQSADRLSYSWQLLPSIHELDAVALVLECAWRIEGLPAAILALNLIRGRPDLRHWRARTECVSERRVVNHAIRIDYWFSRSARITRNCWPRRAAPPVISRVKTSESRGEVPAAIDLKSGDGITGDIIVVDVDAGIGTTGALVVHANSSACTVAQVVTRDCYAAHATKESDVRCGQIS